MAQRRHVSLPKSSVSGQTPSPENLYYGEVAVNYFSGDEFLSIKNTSGNIVTFRTEQYYKEKELVVSSALNDLNDRTSALGDRVTTLENSAPDMSNYATTAVTNALRTDLNITAVALNDLNNRTSALGDRVTTVSGDVETLSGEVQTLSGDVETLSGDVETLSGEVETLSGAVESNAHVTAAALVDLGGRVTTLENSRPDMSNYATTAVTDALRTNLNTVSGDVETLSGTVEENERVTAAALNDINTRLNTVSGNIETNYYTKTQVDNAISSIDTSLFRVVTTLPDSDIDEDKIYLIQSETSGANNVYIEYAYVNNDWEKLGEYKSDIDLSAYALKVDLDALSGEVETLSGTVESNARAAAAALVDLGGRVTTLENSEPDMSNYATTAVTNALRTDLNTVSGKVDSAVTGVTGISGISASVSNGVATVKHTNVAGVEMFAPTYAPHYNTAITQAELVSLLKASGGTFTKKDELMHVTYDGHGHITTPSVAPLIIDDYADSASTNPISNRAVTQVILDNELVVAAALNDLNDKKLDASAYTPGDYASQSDLETLSGTVATHTANTTVHVSAAEKTAWNDKVDVSTLSNYHEKTAVSGLNINALTSGNQAQEVFRIGNSKGAAITVSGNFNSTTTPTNVSVLLEASAGLYVSGGTHLTNLDVKSTLDVSGATKINNNLTVTGNTSVSGTVGVKSTLNVSGATKISNNLTVTGNASVSGTVQSTGVITASAGVKYGAASNYGPWKIWKGTQAEYNSQTPSASDTICIIVSQ